MERKPAAFCHSMTEFANASKSASGRAKSSYNWRMILAILVMRVLEVMFFVGLVGSSVVVIISFIEDGKELFGKD
jgi:hypothetical protein